jgi:ubiquitin-protein ligase
MNISFNTNKKPKLVENSIKGQLDFFKLHVDESRRYITGFEIFPDDNKIMCYMSETEIELSYEGDKIIDIDCYSNEDYSEKLKRLISKDKVASENLIIINNFFMSIDKDSDNDTDTYEYKLKNKNKKNISSIGIAELPSNLRVRSRFQKIFENENESDEEIVFANSESETESETKSESDNSSDEEAYTKESKPVKFEFNIQPKRLIPDLSDDIILTDDTSRENYISYEVINNSKTIGKNSTVHQIVNELNKAIRNTKNIIIKPINTVFEISVENTLPKGTFKYVLTIPQRYPFVPPSLSIKSNFNQSFTYALNNCEILNENKWNPSTTIQDIIVGIFNNVEKLDIDSLTSKVTDQQFYDQSIKLLELTNTEPLNSNTYSLNFDFLKIQDKSASRGIGYDYDKTKVWDVNTYLREQEDKNKKITIILKEILPLISKNPDTVNDTCIIPYIKQCIYDVSILEVEKRKDYYEVLFETFHEIYKLEKYNSYFDIDRVCGQRKTLSDYPKIFNSIPVLEKKIIEVSKDDYVGVMKELAFGCTDIISSKQFKFMAQANERYTGSDFTRRLMSEIKNMDTSLPISETSSIFLRCDEGNMSIMKFLIIPHPDTPYAYGCFEFDMYLPSNYPQSPPHVEIITTGGGTFRFNPNLYDNGKVCLSLLGTWSGSGGESWTSSSTMLQVLISIQSLIFCEEPYFNEPGYERDRNNAKGKELNDKYNEPVRLQTLKLAMLGQLKRPSYGFEDVIKNHFRIHKNKIIAKLEDWQKISTSKATFDLYFNELKGLMDKL